MKLSASFLFFLISTTTTAQAVEFHESRLLLQPSILSAPKSWDGVAKFPGCSGSLIKLTNDKNAKALVMTNGHCTNSKLPAGLYIYDTPVADNRSAEIYTDTGGTVSTRLVRIVYATLTKTDVSIYETESTYAELAAQGAHPFSLSKKSAIEGQAIKMISGYWAQEQSCEIDAIIPELREFNLDTFYAYRYTTGCKSVPGWSGTPLIAKGTRTIVGINNTHYSGGEPCSDDNPCEVDSAGNISVRETGTSYGQQTALIWTCVTKGRFDLNTAGCALKF